MQDRPALRLLCVCIRNVEDRAKALREIYRVLKPGGQLAILELTTPAYKLSAALHAIYTSTDVPAAAHLLSMKSAYDYLVKSVKDFPPQENLKTK